MRAQVKQVAAVVLVSLIMTILRSIIIAYSMEQNSSESDSYYLPNDIEVIIFNIVVLIFVGLFVYSAISLGFKKQAILECDSGAVSAASLVIAFSLIGAAAVHSFFLITLADIEYTVLGMLILIMTVASAGKFLIAGVRARNKNVSNTLKAITAIAPILLMVFRLLGDFMRTSSAPTSSSGAYHIVALAFTLLYFLGEGKAYASKTPASSLYIYGYIAIFFLLTFSIPNIALHCFMFKFDYYAAYSVADLGIAVYIATRLSSIKLVPKSNESVES